MIDWPLQFIPITSQPETGAGEMFAVDPTASAAKSAFSGIVRGKQYKFPPLGRTAYLQSLQWIPGPMVFDSKSLLSLANGRGILVTLAQPDGTIIVNQMPLYLFYRSAGVLAKPTKFFVKDSLIDPRQCYIEYMVAGIAPDPVGFIARYW